VLTVAVINLALGRREFRPSIYGKAATATYIVTCVTIMWFNYLERPSILVQTGIYCSAAINIISQCTTSSRSSSNAHSQGLRSLLVMRRPFSF